MRVVSILVACLCLPACDRQPTAEEVKLRKAEREAKVAAAINRSLSPRVLQAGVHQLVVLDVPFAETRTQVAIERCYVWRDSEFKTATLSCPGGEPTQYIDFEHRP